MKFTVDMTLKTIFIERDCNFSDLVKVIKGMLGDEWKNYKIGKTVEYINHYPYIYAQPWYPTYPKPTWITCNTPVTFTYDSDSTGVNGNITVYSSEPLAKQAIIEG